MYEIHDFPELLSLRGHEVVFVDYPEGESRRGLRRVVDLRTEVRPAQSRAHQGSVVEVRTPGRVLGSPLTRITASITHIPEIWRCLRDGQFDAIVLYSVPTNGWQTVRLARRFGVPVVFRAIDLSHSLRRTPFGWLIRRAERSILKKADWVSVNNGALRGYLIERGADPTRISVDYPGLDLERFHPDPPSAELQARYGLGADERVVVFMGTLFRFAGIDWFIEGFASALRRNRNVRFLIIGGGEEDKRLRRRVRELGLESSVVFAGVVDYRELADHLRLADVAINPFKVMPVTSLALPGKVLQYAGCGIPTVCTPLAGLQGMLADGEGVLYRAAGQPFVDAVVRLLDEPSYRLDLGASARRAVETHCQWDSAVSRFERAIGMASMP